jgi:hypothetical protein
MLTAWGARGLDIPPQQFGTIRLIGSVQLLAAFGKKKREVEGNGLSSYHIFGRLLLSSHTVFFERLTSMGNDVFLRSTLQNTLTSSPHHASTSLR